MLASFNNTNRPKCVKYNRLQCNCAFSVLVCYRKREDHLSQVTRDFARVLSDLPTLLVHFRHYISIDLLSPISVHF